jgi:hypothetical protein
MKATRPNWKVMFTIRVAHREDSLGEFLSEVYNHCCLDQTYPTFNTGNQICGSQETLLY